MHLLPVTLVSSPSVISFPRICLAIKKIVSVIICFTSFLLTFLTPLSAGSENCLLLSVACILLPLVALSITPVCCLIYYPRLLSYKYYLRLLPYLLSLSVASSTNPIFCPIYNSSPTSSITPVSCPNYYPSVAPSITRLLVPLLAFSAEPCSEPGWWNI